VSVAPIVDDSLHKSYGARSVLSGIDLDVGVGEVLGLLGPNGAGKTTTLVGALVNVGPVPKR